MVPVYVCFVWSELTIAFLDDIHFPTLTVDQTVKFAVKNKTPHKREEQVHKKGYVKSTKESVLGALDIGHTAHTKVGNEFIRGVSGGERKRVSLAEMLAGQVSTLLFFVLFRL